MRSETMKPLILSQSWDFKKLQRFLLPIVGIVLVALAFHWMSDGSFLTSRNLSNLSRQVCVNLTLAVGMTLVILTSGIDLSVGSVLALSGMVAAITQVHFGFNAMGATGAFVCECFVGGWILRKHHGYGGRSTENYAVYRKSWDDGHLPRAHAHCVGRAGGGSTGREFGTDQQRLLSAGS